MLIICYLDPSPVKFAWFSLWDPCKDCFTSMCFSASFHPSIPCHSLLVVELAWISPSAFPFIPPVTIPYPTVLMGPHSATSPAALPGAPDPVVARLLWMFEAFIHWVDQVDGRCHWHFLQVLKLTWSPFALLPVRCCPPAGLPDLDPSYIWINFFYGTNLY